MDPFVIRDLRSPAEPMEPFGLKVPPAVIDDLDRLAEQLGTTKAALARQLLVDAVERLEQQMAAATTAQEVR